MSMEPPLQLAGTPEDRITLFFFGFGGYYLYCFCQLEWFSFCLYLELLTLCLLLISSRLILHARLLQCLLNFRQSLQTNSIVSICYMILSAKAYVLVYCLEKRKIGA